MEDIAERGYLVVARFPRGEPIRIHWTAPLGAVLLGNFEFVPGYWLGFFLVILIHELGHAFFVWRAQAQLKSVDVLGYGGLCRWEGTVSVEERTKIVWGGVLAQALLLVLALATTTFFRASSTQLTFDFFQALIRTNAILIGINLLPIPPLDGATAWTLLGSLRRRRQRRRAEAKRRGAMMERRSRRKTLLEQQERVDLFEAELDEGTRAVVDEAWAKVISRAQADSDV